MNKIDSPESLKQMQSAPLALVGMTPQWSYYSIRLINHLKEFEAITNIEVFTVTDY